MPGRVLLRDLAENIGNADISSISLAHGLTIRGAAPILTLVGNAPELRFIEDDQVAPAGAWRILLSGDLFTVQRSITTAPQFGTTANSTNGEVFSFSRASAGGSVITGSSDTGVLRLRSNLASVGGSSNIYGVQLNLFSSAHATTPGRFDLATVIADDTDALIRLIIPGDATAVVTQFLNSQVTFTRATAGIATATATVDISGTDSAVGPLRVVSTPNAASVQLLRLEGDRSVPAANDAAFASFLLSDSAGNQDEFARLTWRGTTVTDGGTQAGDLFFSVLANNVMTEAVRFGTSGTSTSVGFLGAAAVVRQASGANLTNSVTAGGTDDTIANFTDLVTYSNDAAAIRNDIYQLSRKLKQVNDALRLYGLLT